MRGLLLSVLASAPKTITDQLQWVLNAAARLISSTSKFECELSQLLHNDLHWLDVPQGPEQLTISGVHCSIFCTHVFATAGPTVWN